MIGKWVCAFGSPRGVSGITVGLGMMPRGEVGLIVAGLGRQAGIIGEATFTAAAFMCVVTIIVTPFMLKWAVAKYYVEEEINEG